MKIIILMPMATKQIHRDTMNSVLALMSAKYNGRKFEWVFKQVTESMVYDARNQLFDWALQEGFDYVLWIDSDIVFEPEDFVKLLNARADFASGLYFGKAKPHQPIAYINQKRRTPFHYASAEPIKDFNRSQSVDAVGFGFVLLSKKCCEQIRKKFPRPFEPMRQMGEDLSFCWRWRHLNKGNKIQLVADTNLGHMGDYIYTKMNALPTSVRSSE